MLASTNSIKTSINHSKIVTSVNYDKFDSEMRLSLWKIRGNAWLRLRGCSAKLTYVALMLARSGSMTVNINV